MEYIVFLHEAEVARGTVTDIISTVDDLITEKGYKKSNFVVYEYEDTDEYSYYFENSDDLTLDDII